MGSDSIPAVTEDFSSLDFERLWAGRENTTTVERAVLTELLEGVDGRRVLEVGPGAGRLTPVLRGRAREYVALDLHAEFLERIPWTADSSRSVRVVADAHRAPFVGGSFSLIVVVRVFNFFPDPRAFLQEVFRLLAPGGHAVIGYQPHPSLATLVDDYRLFLDGRRDPGAPTLTFSRRPQVPSGPGPFPAWLMTRRFVRSILEQSGFVVQQSLSSGIEDYAIGRRLPPRVFIRLSQVGDRLGFLPTQFVLARKSPGPPGTTLPGWSEMLACPACRAPFGSVEPEVAKTLTCVTCGAPTRVRGGWIDTRGGNPPER
jgi:SAM-dependent methyltransferase